MPLHEWLFLLYVVLVPFMRPFGIDLAGFRVPPSDLLFPLVAMAWLAAVARGEERFVPTPFVRAAVLYLFALAISAVFSSDFGVSAVRVAATSYLVAAGLIAEMYARKRFRRMASVWGFTALVTALIAILGAAAFYAGLNTVDVNIGLAHYGSLPAGNYPRVRALFESMSMLCAYLIASLVMVYAAHLLGWLTGRMFHVLAALISLAAAFTFSPEMGGFALAAGSLVWLDQRDRHPGAARAALGAGVALALLFFSATLLSPADFSQPSPRVLAWRSSYETFLSAPLTGIGVGLPAAEVRYTTVTGANQHLTDAHNTLLSIAAQNGIVGIAAFSYLMAALWPRKKALFQVALIAGFLWPSLTGSFEDTRHVWLLFGIIAAASGDDPAAVRDRFATHARVHRLASEG